MNELVRIGVALLSLFTPYLASVNLGRVIGQDAVDSGSSDLEGVSAELNAERIAARELGQQLGSVELKERRDAAYGLAKLGPVAVVSIDALVEALKDRDEQVWMQSAMAIARIGPPAKSAVAELIENLDQSNDQRRYRAAWAVARIGVAGIDPLTETLQDAPLRRQLGAIDALGWMAPDHPQVISPLLETIGSENQQIRLAAANAVARSRSVEALATALDSPDPQVQAVVAKALAECGSLPTPVRERLLGLNQQGSGPVRAAALIALVSSGIHQAELTESIVQTLLSDDTKARTAAMIALRKLDEPTPVLEQLVLSLRSDRAVERSAAAFAIGLLGSRSISCVPALVQSLKSKDVDADEVMNAISRIGAPAVTPVLQAFSDPAQSRDLLGRTLAMIGPAATAALIAALRDESVDVQLSAASALGRMNPTPESAIDELALRMSSESAELRAAVIVALAECRQLPKEIITQFDDCREDKDAGVRSAGLRAVAKHRVDRPVVLEILLASLDDPSPDVRCEVIVLLGELDSGGSQSVPPITEALRDPASDVRRAAAKVLAGFGREASGSLAALAVLLDDTDPRSRAASARAIGEIGSAPAAVADRLFELLADSNEEVVFAVLTSLSQIGAKATDGTESVKALLRHPQVAIRGAAVTCLATIESDTKKSVPLLIDSLGDEDWTVRREAANGLGKIGSPAATPAVPTLLRLSQNEEDRDAARGALRSIDDAGRDAVPLLIEALESGDRGRRFYAVHLLGKAGADARDALPAIQKIRDASDSNRFKEMVDRTIKSIETAGD